MICVPSLDTAVAHVLVAGVLLEFCDDDLERCHDPFHGAKPHFGTLRPEEIANTDEYLDGLLLLGRAHSAYQGCGTPLRGAPEVASRTVPCEEGAKEPRQLP